VRPTSPEYLGLGLLAGSLLLLEIALTRAFAIMLWHHLAYMVISVAMLGFGVAGSLLKMWGARLGPVCGLVPPSVLVDRTLTYRT
jgi:hypothetical protein